MALSKIELKLGKKVITLTPEQFEELKADMRELDKQHNYYWHGSPWYRQWYNQSPALVPLIAGSTSSGGSISTASGKAYNNATNLDSVQLPISDDSVVPIPPAFSGSILSTV